jgi:dipeptidase D
MVRTTTLEPKAVWQIFGELSKVPRDSGKEEAAMQMLRRWAESRGLAAKRDKTGNMVVSVPATKGHEKAPPVLLQGHVDMVCEKNSATVHDFDKDPIKIVVDGDWVRAEGTTLGADNGIGVAMALAVAEDKTVVHGPVEVLLTVDEERGLTGAAGVKKGFFTARKMINLDSEEDDGIFIGCAGGRDTFMTLRNRRTRFPKDVAARKVTVTGLRGGHSGQDINRNRGNAIKILTRLLIAAADEMDIRIATIDGGSKRNAIPREAAATVLVPSARAAEFKRMIGRVTKRIMADELAGIDDQMQVKVTPSKASRCFSLNGSLRTLRLLAAVPSGVTAMSQVVDGLVESSSNLGVVTSEGEQVRITCCSRSSVVSSLEYLAIRHRALGRLAGAVVEQPEGYPGWKPNLESEMLAVARKQYVATFGHEPELKAIHAGLECGLLTEKYPDLDIISFGPNIVNVHSPDEQVSIPSVQKVWKFLGAILAEVA